MPERIVSPTGRGLLLLDSHPTGCAANVARLRAEAGEPAGDRTDGPVAIVIGSSAGYGLATTIAGLVRHGIRGVGVSLERPPGRRTGTAGWYNTIATGAIARELSHDFSFVNDDAFADTTKTSVLDLVAKRFGGVDYLIYSVAAPRRTDPRSGVTYQSVIKTLGGPFTTKSLAFDTDGGATLQEITVEPADEAEAAATVQVMGGEDWSRWVDALLERGLVRDGFRTVALTYIGSSVTAPIYRSGTIGAAKAHLEASAKGLAERLSAVGGNATTVVNGAAVTQASTAIPTIALYTSLLRSVLGAGMQSPVQQSVRLWDFLTGAESADVDDEGRIRLDRWELAPEVQAAVHDRWKVITPANLPELADLVWFRSQFRALYGFDVPGVDYTKPVDPDLPWPAV
jgi:enoyl-[acyl-carrier protein] reductase/trans-2-enoyl-CoA reductase (NAD+)